MEEGKPLHVPVLAKQVIETLHPQTGQTFLDLTVGYGGHAKQILSAVGKEGKLYGIDTDPAALQACSRRFEEFGQGFIPLHGNFAEAGRLLQAAGAGEVDGILIDLGVSSPQLDNPARGFSFRTDGPLDMRMDPTGSGPTAAQIVNQLREDELADVIYEYGEERLARRIARTIVRERSKEPIETTERLARIVKYAYPKRRHRIHPATRTFQALRIHVNGERDNLRAILEQAPALLRDGGRIAVISFHSLEDRFVKHTFREQKRLGGMNVMTKKPIRPDDEECDRNPRARSAKMRVAVKEAT